MNETLLQIFSIRDFKTKYIKGYVYEGDYQTEIAISISGSQAPRCLDLVRDTNTGIIYEVERVECSPIITLNNEVNPQFDNVILYVTTKINKD